jgi:hypothetical protein
MRMVALWAGRFRATTLEVMTALLAVMPDRQYLHEQLRSFSDGSASRLGENGSQTIGIEYPASTNGKVNSSDSAGSIAVRSLIDDCQDTIDYFAFVHAPPRGRMK